MCNSVEFYSELIIDSTWGRLGQTFDIYEDFIAWGHIFIVDTSMRYDCTTPVPTFYSSPNVVVRDVPAWINW